MGIKANFSFLKRNFILFFFNLLIFTLFLFLFSFFSFSETIFGQILKEIENKANFSVYFKEEVEEKDILALKDEISKTEEVEWVNYISKNEALEEFLKRHQQNQTLIEAVKEIGNPFLASLSVKLKDPQFSQKILEFFKNKEDMVEKIDYFEREEIIQKIFSFSKNLKKTIFFAILFFLFLAFLTVFVTVNLSIFRQKEEILIQKLIGASDFKISFPFLFQGILVGILATLISIPLLFFLFYFLSRSFFLFFSLSVFDILKENLFFIFLKTLFLGIFLGALTNFLATKLYLKE